METVVVKLVPSGKPASVCSVTRMCSQGDLARSDAMLQVSTSPSVFQLMVVAPARVTLPPADPVSMGSENSTVTVWSTGTPRLWPPGLTSRGSGAVTSVSGVSPGVAGSSSLQPGRAAATAGSGATSISGYRYPAAGSSA